MTTAAEKKKQAEATEPEVVDPNETAPEGSVLIKAPSPGTGRLKPFTPDELAELVAAQTDTPADKIESVEVLETTHRIGIDVVLAVKVELKK